MAAAVTAVARLARSPLAAAAAAATASAAACRLTRVALTTTMHHTVVPAVAAASTRSLEFIGEDIDDKGADEARGSKVAPGSLAVVATPIGNLRDLSARAAAVLAEASMVAAEDTRVTRKLLAALPRLHGVTPCAEQTLVSCNEFSEEARAATVLSQLRAGKVVALVSDAGTPAISDPGARIVAAVRAAGFPVVPVPGPCAAVTALSAAGILMTAGYSAHGFLPRAGEPRRAALHALAQRAAAWRRAPSLDAAQPAVLYEAPHRLQQTLDELAAALPAGVGCVVARELTKMYESIRTFPTLAAAAADARATAPRGEYVLILHATEAPRGGGGDEAAMTLDDAVALVADAQAGQRGLRTSEAIARVVDATGVSRKALTRAVVLHNAPGPK